MKIFVQIATYIVLLIPLFSILYAQAAIFRCELEGGHFRYQQSPCNADSEPLILKNRSSGWSPLRESEKALVRSNQPKRKTPARTVPDKKTTGESKICWSKRKKLQAIREKLRHGYKLKESAALHRNRDDYEDYLKQFCSL